MLQKTTYTQDLDGLIDWLETVPSEEKYCWRTCRACLVHEFLTRGMGIENPIYIPYESIFPGENRDARVSAYQYVGSGRGYNYNKDWTFGQALDRAKKLRDGYRP